VTKVNTVASGIGSISYSTYFGGGTPSGGTAVGGGIAVDSTGNIYFSAPPTSPTPGPAQPQTFRFSTPISLA